MNVSPTISELDELILRQRSVALARSASAEPSAPSTEMVSVRCGPDRYAIEARSLSAVAALTRLTPLPHAPRELAGLFGHAGRIVPAFYLSAVLGLPLTTLPEFGRVVVLGAGDDQVALVVDAVEGVVFCRPAELQELPPTIGPLARELIVGIDPGGFAVLDAAALLRSPKLVVDIPLPRFAPLRETRS